MHSPTGRQNITHFFTLWWVKTRSCCQMITRVPVHKLMRTTPGKPTLYVPKLEKVRILRLYGEWNLEDFDINYHLNRELGGVYPTSFDTMLHYMNLLEPNEQYLQVHYHKLGRQGLKDGFNIVQSAVRSRVGEKFWCE